MAFRRFTAGAVAVFAVAVAAVLPGTPFNSTSSALAVTNCSTSTAGLDAAELEMLELHNAVRRANGLSELVLSPTLSRVAAWKSEDSSASGPGFGHTDSLGRSIDQRAADCGWGDRAAENIAHGYPSVQATFDAWMKSPGHRQNILMSYYVSIGIGRTGNNWTTNFAIVAESASPVAASAAPAATPAPQAAPPPTARQQAAPPPPAPKPPRVQLAAGTNRLVYNGPAGWTADLLSRLGGSVQFVYSYDTARGVWLRYHPGAESYVNSLAWIEPGREIIVSVSGPTEWLY
jgi:uncharacterized protein YkwD